MSIDYATIYPCLQKWACDATRINAYWQNQPNTVPRDANNRSHIDMFVSLVETVGTDQSSIVDNEGSPWAEDSDGDPVQCVAGMRNMTVSFQALTRSQTPNDIAPAYLETLRGSLRMESFKKVFRECGIALVSLGNVIPLDAKFDDRWESIAEMDIVFGVVSRAIDERGSVEFIEQVEMSSCLSDPSGELLPQSAQMVDQLIPNEVP